MPRCGLCVAIAGLGSFLDINNSATLFQSTPFGGTQQLEVLGSVCPECHWLSPELPPGIMDPSQAASSNVTGTITHHQTVRFEPEPELELELVLTDTNIQSNIRTPRAYSLWSSLSSRRSSP